MTKVYKMVFGTNKYKNVNDIRIISQKTPFDRIKIKRFADKKIEITIISPNLNAIARDLIKIGYSSDSGSWSRILYSLRNQFSLTRTISSTNTVPQLSEYKAIIAEFPADSKVEITIVGAADASDLPSGLADQAKKRSNTTNQVNEVINDGVALEKILNWIKSNDVMVGFTAGQTVVANVGQTVELETFVGNSVGTVNIFNNEVEVNITADKENVTIIPNTAIKMVDGKANVTVSSPIAQTVIFTVDDIEPSPLNLSQHIIIFK